MPVDKYTSKGKYVSVTGDICLIDNKVTIKRGATIDSANAVPAKEFELYKSITSSKTEKGTLSGQVTSVKTLEDGNVYLTISGVSVGCCNGYKRNANATTSWVDPFWIQFEICDDEYKDKGYFDKVYKEACEFTAYICKKFNIDPNGTVDFNGAKIPTILCHADSYALGMGGNHGDVYSWFKAMGLPRNMDNVRSDVAEILKESSDITPIEKPIEVDYSIFKENTLVSIASDATYYSGSSIPAWVKKQNWYVHQDAKSDRVIINKSESGSNAIMSPINACYLTIVKKASTPVEESVVVEPIEEPYSGVASTGSKADEKKIWDFLLSKIGNEFGVAGLMGNLYAESALRSNNLQNTYEKSLALSDTEYTAKVDDGSYTNFVKDSAGYGLAQWTYWSRKENLYNFAQESKKSIGDLTMQLEFLYKELSSGYKKSTLTPLMSAKSVLEASNVVLLQFERPASKDSPETQAKRASYGQKYYDLYKTVVEQPEIEEPTEPPVVEEPTPPVIDEPITNPTEQDNNEKETEQKPQEPVEEPKTEDEPVKDTDNVELTETQKSSLISIIVAIIKFIKNLFNGKDSDK